MTVAVRINLLPDGRGARQTPRGGSGPGGEPTVARAWFTVPILVALVALLICWLVYDRTSRRLDGRIAEAQAELDRLAPIVEQADGMQRRGDELQRRARIIEQLKANQRGPAEVMDRVSRALPELLWLTRLAMTENVVDIQGEAFNTNAVAAFLESLERVESFRDPVLRATQRRDPVYTFDLTFRYATAPEAPAPGEDSAGET